MCVCVCVRCVPCSYKTGVKANLLSALVCVCVEVQSSQGLSGGVASCKRCVLDCEQTAALALLHLSMPALLCLCGGPVKSVSTGQT